MMSEHNNPKTNETQEETRAAEATEHETSDPIDLTGFEGLTGPAAFKAQQPTSQEQHHNEVIAEHTVSIEQYEALEKELTETKDKLLRAVAETENMRVRARREREDASKFAVSNFARDLLEVADNFRRALDAAPEDREQISERMKLLLEGIEATERSMMRTFEKNKIEQLDPTGQKFDPNFHEVMFEAPMPDKENGTIIQVLEVGYTLNGRLLRPARVGISKNEGGAPPTEHKIDQEV